MTTSDTLIGQALAGAGPGGLGRGWESSREAQRPEAGSAATTSAALPLPLPPRSSPSHYPQSHNNLHFRLPAAVADARLRKHGAARAPIGWGGSHVTGMDPDPPDGISERMGRRNVGSPYHPIRPIGGFALRPEFTFPRGLAVGPPQLTARGPRIVPGTRDMRRAFASFCRV